MTDIEKISLLSKAKQRDEILGVLEYKKLSYNILTTSETAFKLHLIQQCKKDHPLVYKVWKIISNKSVINFTTITVNKDSWVSYSLNSQGKLQIGGKEIPPVAKDQMIFMDKNFDYHQEILWKFSHELSHIITHSLRNDALVSKFFQNIVTKSRENGKGLSLIGSMEFYKSRGGINEQATEDITDLTNMYLLNPEYLRSRLHYLVRTNASFSDTYKVCKLTKDSSEYIFNNIEYIVTTFLSEF